MNRLELAVAGGRKTQGIVERCAASHGKRILVVTYTLANQKELRGRLAAKGPLASQIEVQGWFSFLLNYWIKPYLPCLFPGRRLRGLNFDGDPGMYAKGVSRFLDDEGHAYALHLAQLALLTAEASGGAVCDRLERIYDQLYVDEVQDLNGYDLEVLLALAMSKINLSMVGDIRQALLLTNPRDPKNSQYKGIQIKKWFDRLASKGLLEVTHSSTTWRSNQAIADFADSIFDEEWGFEKTISANAVATGHDGVFVLHPSNIDAYVATFTPTCLRHSSASATDLDLPFVNFGIAKGMSVDRVLIAPTGPIKEFLRKGKQLEDQAACALYVAVTRARFSVAFVTEYASKIGLDEWTP